MQTILRLVLVVVILLGSAAAFAAPTPLTVTDGALFVNVDTAFTVDPLTISGVDPISINRSNSASSLGAAIDPCCTASASIGLFRGAQLPIGTVHESMGSELILSGGPVTPENPSAPFSLSGLVTVNTGEQFNLQGSGFAKVQFVGPPSTFPSV